jgi:hypothetical protein
MSFDDIVAALELLEGPSPWWASEVDLAVRHNATIYGYGGWHRFSVARTAGGLSLVFIRRTLTPIKGEGEQFMARVKDLGIAVMG